MATSVYVSYSWTAERENPVIDGLGEACKAYGLDFQRDRTRLKHGDLIRQFMDEIGSSGNIIPVFSRPYFESEYCMYELLQVWKNGNFQQRIHPILVGKIRLDDADLQLELIDYWEKKARTLQDKLNQRDLGNTLELQKRRIVYAEIYRNIGDLLAFVSNMNITPLDQLQRGRFGALLERIGKPSPPGPAPQPLERGASPRRAGEGEQKVPFIETVSYQGNSPLDSHVSQRMSQLEEQLGVWQKKLHHYEMKLVTADHEDEFRIKEQISREITPAIAKITREYSRLAAQVEYTEAEAEPIVAELMKAIEGERDQLVQYAPNIQSQLDGIRQELRDLNKSATAKLKVALPIVPTLVSYELDLDTENFLTEIWGKIRGLLRKKAVNPQ